MPASFDPLYTWLGIPPEEQPPNHYRLLGLKPFESNAEVISNASDRQMLLLRTFQTGKHSAQSQRLLNYVAAAKVCLLNPNKKAAYDAELRRQLDEQQAAQVSTTKTSDRPAERHPAAVADTPETASLKEDSGPAGGPEGPSAESIDVPVFEVRPPSRRATGRARHRRAFKWDSPIVIGGVAAGMLVMLALALLVFRSGPAEAPVLKLAGIAPVTVRQGNRVTFTAQVEQPEVWAGRVKYSLAAGAPSGTKINSATGEFSWLPEKSGEYQITIRVAARDSDAADQTALRIRVEGKTKEPQPSVKPPVLAAISDQTVEQGAELTTEAKVESPGEPQAKLEFSLGSNAPPGMGIDRTSGKITWQPSDDHPPGEFPVTVVVTSAAPGSPTDEKTFTVPLTARETGRPPVLSPIPDQKVEFGQPFVFSLGVDDPGAPAAQLVFSLAPSAPSGMKIDSKVGRITWNPAKGQAPGKYSITVVATSTAPSRASDEKSFAIEVTAKPEQAPKHPIPSEEAQAKALATVKGLFQEEYRQNHTHARLALAARLIRCARDSKDDPVARYVMLREAERLAEQGGNCLLGLLVADELGRTFALDSVPMKVGVLQRAARQARHPAAVALTAEATFALASEAVGTDAYQSVLPLCRQVEAVTRKVCGPRLGDSIQRRQKLLEERQRLTELGQAAAATLEPNPDDSQANLDLGQSYCLVEEDWEKGLPHLGKGADQRVGELAKRLVAEPADVATQLEFADAWWESAQEKSEASGSRLVLQRAARHWYREALPRLTGLDLVKVRGRLDLGAGTQRDATPQPFHVWLGGLGGVFSLPPSKVTGNVSAQGGFASLAGRASIVYPPVPVSSYVHEFELTFMQPAGSMTLAYGDPRQSAKIGLVWMEDQRKFRCRLYTYREGWSFWGGERNYDPGQRLRFTLYVNENRQRLYQDGSPILGAGATPADLQFRVSTGNGTAAVISRCALRPWTDLDAQRDKCPKPPTRIECDLPETALHLYERNVGLAERPSLADEKSFVVRTIGMPMVWIPPGSFKRPHSKQPNQATEITISNGFWIGRHEVTQGEWAALGLAGSSRVVGSPFLPVDGASWEEAMNFCALLNRAEGQSRRAIPKGYEYRLPTEAEREYACRAGSEQDFSVQPDGFWCAANSGWRPHQVGQGKPNPWGIYDMHGNVAEWCFDAWQDEPETPVWRVQDPVLVPSSPDGLFVLRGGAWWSGRDVCSSRARIQYRSVSGGHRGFRVVLGTTVRRG